MRKTIAAASIAATGLGVLGLGASGALADDADDPGDDRSGWVEDALEGLVDDGTLTQDQADAVEDALHEARPHRLGPWGFGLGPGGDLSTLTESLGLDEDELRAQLRDGRTIAEIAEEQGVDVEDVVDDLLAAHEERLDEAVADGRLTEEQADEIRGDAEERITDLVNGGLPEPPDGPGHHPWGPGEDGSWGHGRGGPGEGWGEHGDAGEDHDRDRGGDPGDDGETDPEGDAESGSGGSS